MKEGNKEMICFRLDPNLIRILRGTAANTGMSIVSIVEDALDRRLGQGREVGRRNENNNAY